MDTNIRGFEVGDHIVIQTKIDGANSCITYDSENDKLTCFSSKNELSYDHTLRGLWNYAQQLDKAGFKNHPTWRVFGEWAVPHTIIYNEDTYNKWYVFDIFDIETKKWLLQSDVESFCKDAGLIYTNTYYNGKFVSWDHVKSFLNNPVYGEQLEGIVIKNQTKMNDDNNRFPSYLKIVNPIFKEIKIENHRRKIEDPHKIQERTKAQEIVDIIVTKARVEKQIKKMIDENILPEQMRPEDMRIVAQNLPKRIYLDCVKEHGNMVESAGEYFGKMCSQKAMCFAREIILCN